MPLPVSVAAHWSATGTAVVSSWPLTNEGAGAVVMTGATVSRVMVWLADGEMPPAPLRNCAKTVLVPSPAGRVNGAVAAKGTQGPKVVPSLEKRMSETGSPKVGLVAARPSVTLVVLAAVAPELTVTVPVGAAVSR